LRSFEYEYEYEYEYENRSLARSARGSLRTRRPSLKGHRML
jgi:hypothetical protein